MNAYYWSAMMSRMYLSGFFLAGMLFVTVAQADGHSACAKCHDADEFSGVSAAELEAGLRDTSIPPHKKFTELSDEQVQAIAAELAGG